VVRLSDLRFGADALDGLGPELVVRAEVGQALPNGYSYAFSLSGSDPRPAIEGRATIALVG
jgi:hypothetical protein